MKTVKTAPVSTEPLQVTIDRMVADAMQRVPEVHQPHSAPTPADEIAQRLAAARFREQFGEIALACGARPAAIKFLLRDAIDVFTLTDSGFVPTHGDRDPADPLRPLSPQGWLEQVKRRERCLFL